MPIPKRPRFVQKLSLSDQIYRDLRDWIVDGTLVPGEFIRDAELARQLGISRTPVREALNRLKEDGLVVTAANRWTRVAEISSEEIDQLIPIVDCLENLALTQAFPALTPHDLEIMTSANAQIKQAMLKGQFDLAAEANRRFHNTFIFRSGNSELVDIIFRVKLKIRRMGTFYFSASHVIPSSTIQEHADLVIALEDEDLERSQESLTHHWTHVAQRLRDAAAEQSSELAR